MTHVESAADLLIRKTSLRDSSNVKIQNEKEKKGGGGWAKIIEGIEEGKRM